MVVVWLSNECNFPSVAQKHSRMSAIVSRRVCAPLIGPSSASALSTASWPPGSSLVSGGIISIMMKYSPIDITIENGAAAMSQDSHVTS